MLANDASFSVGVTEIPLEDATDISCSVEEEGDTAWDICEVAGWDMTAGLPGEQGDEQYTVFVKFLDKYGYESPVYRASAVKEKEPG